MSHLVLALPLAGVHRIEASAGTGKTFTLALAHTRLVIERGLDVRRILAVTFTEAATQELRERLRRQLDRAAALAGDEAARIAALSSPDAADALTATLIARRLHDEPAEALARRLRQAAADIDLAAVFTIHGFCQRVLGEHALAVGEPLLPREMLGNERPLLEEVARDLWRSHTREADDARRMTTLWRDPAAFARDLRLLLHADALRPPRAEADAGASAALAAAADALRAAWHAHGAQAWAAIEDARARKVFHGNKLRADTLGKLRDALAAFADDATLPEPPTDKLDYVTAAGLRARGNAGREDEMPDSPLFAAIADFLAARDAAARAEGQAVANLLHDLRDAAAERLRELKAQRGQLGFDDLIAGVHDALHGPHGDALAAALRAQYPVALVDEFQDTDARQWAIFRRVYVEAAATEATALYLIGDPKQAIYRFRGGDVHTYHRAGGDAQSTHALDANFRSRPTLLRAIAAVFARGGDFPFADGETPFPAVRPGGRVADDDFRVGERVAPALHLWSLPLRPGETTTRGGGVAIKTDAARALAAATTAARIHAVLTGGDACLRDGGVERPPRPGDIAVLVNTHREAAQVQRALAARGIPAVTTGRASLFATDEARELLWLLDALRDPADEGRLRAALATVLLGLDAAAIDALAHDERAHRHWLDAFAQWRERWDRHGPLALIAARVAEAAPRLLPLADGERRLTNYLQLAEHLQEASVLALGPAGLVDWLARRIALADEHDDAQQLRLESDAERVRILTLHRSKGLEFPLVFLPFAALPPSRGRQGLALVEHHDGARRVQHARIGGLDDGYDNAAGAARSEILAEQLRLLYVGLTRARHALWLAAGAVNGGEDSALAWLLGGGGIPGTLGEDDVLRAIAALVAAAPDAIVHEDFPALDAVYPPPATAVDDAPPPLRAPRRALRRDWWVHSFSQLAREDGGEDERRAEDEMPASTEADAERSPFAGARFGNVLHAALEHVDFAAWRGWCRDEPPPTQAAPLREALRGGGYDSDALLAEGERLLAALVRHTLNTPLPEGIRLAELPPQARRNELEFHFALRPVAVPALLELLHAHGLLRERHGFGARERLEGLMTGKIDLVYLHAGRCHLLDYKSNRLRDYGEAGVLEAMRHGEYELQYAIYALALHRWLRFRMPGYDYDRHFGGVRYLFCRGLDADASPSPGVFARTPPRALIEGMDALFGVPAEDAA